MKPDGPADGTACLAPTPRRTSMHQRPVPRTPARRLLWTSVAACAALVIGGRTAAADEPARDEQAAIEPTPAVGPASTDPTINPDQLAAWILELDSDRFAVREDAQQRLLTAGPAALDAVAAAASKGSLESSTRAVGILIAWSRSADNSLSLGALERLSMLTNRPAEAAMATERLADVREKAAMEAIVSMGGHVEFDRQTVIFSGPFPSLQVIIGPRWKGGTGGLGQVSAVRRASTVSFYSSAIDGDAAVTQLAALAHIQRVEFYGTPISDDALARLREALPHAMIDVRGGARLGIAGSQMPGGAGVAEVQPGTAAEKAGLMPNDLITEIAGVPVADFDSLTKEIAKKKAGDTVVLKVIRTGQMLGQPQPRAAQPIEITVRFEEWNDQQAVNPNAPSPLSGMPLGMPGGLPAGMLINRR